ncbi:MAG: hypothetical protein KJO35_00870, partial [Gammaproteobacteria bacterium]|nr:hypothetical protein [Gammaproteobacteria bacterium]
MSDKPGHEKDAGLDDESMVTRAYSELKRNGPSPGLDAKILAAAREATQQDKTIVHMQRWRKWSVPAALAATVVFAVPLVVRVFDSAPADFNQDSFATSMQANEASSDKPQEETRPSAAARVEAMEAIEAQSLTQTAEQERQVSIPAPALADDAVARNAKAETRHRQRDDNRLASDVNGDPAAGSPREHALAMAAETGLQPARQEVVEPDTEASGFAPPPQAATRPDPAPGPAEYRASGSDEAAELADVDKPAVTIAGSRDKDELSPATERLQKIVGLMQQQRIFAARHELGAFLQDYPGYTLPADFPLHRQDAIPVGKNTGNDAIVPEAELWLRGIAEL